MYYLFYCPDFNISSYQLVFICSTTGGCSVGNWQTSAIESINSPCLSSGSSTILTPETRIKRFQTSHNNTKTLHLIAQAPTPQDFYTLYPELFL